MSLLLTPAVLRTLIVIAFGVFIVMSVILHYHWRSFSTNDPTVRKTTRVYYGGGIILFALALLMTFFV